MSQPSTNHQPKWVLGNLIGRGTYGSVYRAHDPASGTEVAVKHLCLASAEQRDPKVRALKQLQREIEVLRDFSHPHIIKFLGTRRSATELYIAMELCPSGSVAGLIAQRKCAGLPAGVALRYTRQLIEGLAYLHEHRVIHRDIKGGNLLLAEIDIVFSRITQNTSISICDVTELKEKTWGSIRGTTINLCH